MAVKEPKYALVNATFGVSSTPVPLARAAPALVSNVRLLFMPLNGNTQTTFVIVATDGSSMIAFDHITMIVPLSP